MFCLCNRGHTNTYFIILTFLDLHMCSETKKKKIITTILVDYIIYIWVVEVIFIKLIMVLNLELTN